MWRRKELCEGAILEIKFVGIRNNRNENKSEAARFENWCLCIGFYFQETQAERWSYIRESGKGLPYH